MRDWLSERAQSHPQHVAIEAATRLTFAHLDERATDVARRLARIAAPGDRIALLARNGAHVAIALHAIGRLGAIFMPLNTRLTAAELAAHLGDARPTVVLFDEHTRELASAALAACALSITAVVLGPDGTIDVAPADEPAQLRTHIDLDEPHSIIFTSGTTGRSKGAVLTWGNVWWSAVGSAMTLGHALDDAWLVPLPLFHVGGLSVLMRSVIGGITAHIHSAFEPDACNRAIDDGGVTIASVVPVMLERMLDARADRAYPSSLRCILLGGAPASQALLERCARIGVPVAMSYGLTEACSQVATLQPRDALRKLGSSGRPLITTELRIVPLPESTTDGDGEIVLRGPTLVREYWERPEATERAWRDGWFHTGDVGRLDAEGYLTVLDRRDDLIVSGGENVYPAEIERALLEHPSVLEAGAYGIPDPTWGTIPLAIVRAEAPLEAAELTAFLASRLAKYKRPRAIVIAAEPLPRNAGGKLLRRDLPAFGQAQGGWTHADP